MPNPNPLTLAQVTALLTVQVGNLTPQDLYQLTDAISRRYVKNQGDILTNIAALWSN
jgi:hypothetical protein